MLEPEPRWTLDAKGPVTQWYGHVLLLDEFVLGQWVCVRRDDGTLLWKRRMRRANTIAGVQNGVIVGSEMRSDGPWTVDFGCYGIELATGRLLWVSHREGLWGTVVRVLDYVPGFTNELRDAPVRVLADGVMCRSGRVLDLRTGWLLRRVPRDSLPRYQEPTDPAGRLYNTRPDRIRIIVGGKRRGDAAPPPVEVADAYFISHTPPAGAANPPEGRKGPPEFALYGTDGRGALRWSFRLSDTPYHGQSNFYSYRLACPFVYLAVSESQLYVPIDSRDPRRVRYNPARWHALVLDARSGAVVQDILLGLCQTAPARIEDVDDRAVLFSLDRCRLVYHARCGGRIPADV